MRTIMMLAAVFFICSPPAESGGHPSIYLTGNPRVDFFGAGAAGPLAVKHGNPLFMQDEGSSPAGGKSPWLAAVLSLAVPGAGEVYAGSYFKGAAFFAAEAVMWGFAWSYDTQGDDLTDEYKRYANDYWSATRYVDWTLNHLGSLNPDLTTSSDEYRDLVYPDEQSPCDPPFSCVDWQELNDMERDIASGRLNGYTHGLPYYGEQQYYELIGKYEQFSRGWDDSGVLNPELENNVPIRSTSERFFEYAKMRARANDKYDVASTFVSLAVVNHVLSAMDAFWSVTRLNKSLHAGVRIKMQKSPFGSVPVTTASFRYDF
ncbi:MAG TPA: hypothetical protein VI932_06005 [Bacteroidota bacterium]|nr:hypothetical protein [Bacteroidota bacterium]